MGCFPLGWAPAEWGVGMRRDSRTSADSSHVFGCAIVAQPVQARGRVHAPAPTRVTRPHPSKGRLSFNGINPSVGVLVVRVSDGEVLGEHGHLAARSPSAACAAKPTEVGGGVRRAKAQKSLQPKDDSKTMPLPMWGRVWGYPKRRIRQPDFLQRRFETLSKRHRQFDSCANFAAIISATPRRCSG